MMITILNDIVNDIKLKSNKIDNDKFEEYKEQLDRQFGVNIDESNKVIKEYKNNT